MTATADEDSGDLKAYQDQPALIQQTVEILAEQGLSISHEADRQGRAFVRSILIGDEKHIVALILDRLGIDDDIWVLALQEKREMHAELCIDDEEPIYISDGMNLTPDGRLVRA